MGVKGGPFQVTANMDDSPVYWLWQVAFRWGTPATNGSEHKIDGIA